MSAYKGFITLFKWINLRDRLRQIADIRGLENKLHHLYQPDTDMNDKICENLFESVDYILLDIEVMKKKLTELAYKIAHLKEI